MANVERWYLGKVRINRGGYDARGQYFGVGAPVYRWQAPDGRGGEVRAYDRLGAAREIAHSWRAWYPEGIQFYGISARTLAGARGNAK